MIDRYRARMMQHRFFEQRAAATLRQIPQEHETTEEPTPQEMRVKVKGLLLRLDEWEADCHDQAATHRAVLNAMLADIGEEY